MTADQTVVLSDDRPPSPQPSPPATSPPDRVRWLPVALWLAFVILACSLFGAWRVQRLYLVTGDEPHYLVIADGIYRDHTFEQTATYRREFEQRRIYSPGLAPRNAVPSSANAHAIPGQHGLYNVHNIGLPILLVIPFEAGRVLGAKLALVFGMSLVVPLAWRFAIRFSDRTAVRVLCTLATTCSVPFLMGSNQIYPDLPAGVLALIVLDRTATLLLPRPADWAVEPTAEHRGATGEPRRPLLADWTAIAAVCFLPWLQIKFAAAAVLAIAGLVIGWRRQGRSLMTIAVRLVPFLGSVALLGTYNLYAFGKATGPYGGDTLELNRHSLMVLAGLHLDRFQGILIQNPVYLAGVLFAVPFLRRFRLFGWLVVLLYASFVVPNAMHPNWYGGQSFAGRFMWSGAVVALPMVLYGVARLAAVTRAWLPLVVGSIGITAWTWASLLIGPDDIYNYNPETGLPYPALFPFGSRHLPLFENPTVAAQYWPNRISLLATLVVVIAGALLPVETAPSPPGASPVGAAGLEPTTPAR